MLIGLGLVMLVLLLLGFPMMVPLAVGALYMMFTGMTFFGPDQAVSWMINGVGSWVLAAVPMFIFAADILTKGHTANRLLDLVDAFTRHMRGGLPITTAASCALFGAVSGSTQATVVAMGGPMRPRLLAKGYPDSFALALIINASDIALLIPPSIGFIVYGVVMKTSIGDLFLAGILPGLLILLMFALYCYIGARIKGIEPEQPASWSERLTLAQDHSAAGVSGSGGRRHLRRLLQRGRGLRGGRRLCAAPRGRDLPTGPNPRSRSARAVDGHDHRGRVHPRRRGRGLFKALGTAGVPDQILGPAIEHIGDNQILALLLIAAAFFVGCMFVDPIVVILILVPIFKPLVQSAGLDPVHVGVIVTLQAAIGSATPPFGCDIFTAIAVFRRPYMEVIRGTPPFIAILLLATFILILFPQISLFLPSLGGQ